MHDLRFHALAVLLCCGAFAAAQTPAAPSTENQASLLAMAKERFGALTPAEEKFFRSVAAGEKVSYNADPQKPVDPGEAESWGPDRVLAADRIVWLCTDAAASKRVTHAGLSIDGARVEGTLVLVHADVPFPLRFTYCALEDLDLAKARLRELWVYGCHVAGIRARSAQVEGEVWLIGSKVRGVVTLLAMSIGGDLNCGGAEFINPTGRALWAEDIEVKGGVYLRRGFKAEGEVNLMNARIDGILSCHGAELVNPKGKALSAEYLTVGTWINLGGGFKAHGKLVFSKASVRGSLSATGAEIVNPEGQALVAQGLRAGGGVRLDGGFTARGEVNLSYASIGGLHCSGGSFVNPEGSALVAAPIAVEDNVDLDDGFNAIGGVSLVGASIGGLLTCTKGVFSNPAGVALDLTQLEVGGDVRLLGGFKAEGETRGSGASIGGSLLASGEFINPEGDALFATSLEVERDVLMIRGCTARGRVVLKHAHVHKGVRLVGVEFVDENGTALLADGIEVGTGFEFEECEVRGAARLVNGSVGGSLACVKSRFSNPEGVALSGNGLSVGASLFFTDGCKVEGEVDLVNASIGGQLNCSGVRISNAGSHAINAASIDIERDALLGGLEAEGEVDFATASIGGDARCRGAKFSNPGNRALDVSGIRIAGSLLMGGIEADGEVKLVNASIVGDLDCGGARFSCRDGNAFFGDGIRVGGDVSLSRGFEARGVVRLGRTASVGGDLVCDTGKFFNPKGDPKDRLRTEAIDAFEGLALVADGIDVGGSVLLRAGFEARGVVVFRSASIRGRFTCTTAAVGELGLDLRSASVGILADSPSGWPKPGRLLLDGFTYGAIADGAPSTCEERLPWLRQPEFSPQPYQQLASALKKAGRKEEATRVLVAKENDPARVAQLGWIERSAHGVLGLVIAYGHRPWRAGWYSLGFVLLGWLLFRRGIKRGLLVSDDDSSHAPNSLFYSLDAFVPIVDFHQVKLCLPKPGLLRGYFWFHTVAGWTLTTMFIAGIAGMFRTASRMVA